ncbi:unnamed protein product [Prorocentrum cordatum]|uniref:Phospholipase B-like n=1 Tax=Prorocentrum cordatum TaxID=2364126 RepID=A0ABN9WS33_9DINO|nr:unnamed protein product [Polarella glacialis]
MQTPPPSGNSPAYGVLRCAAAGLDGGAAGGRGAWRARLSAALAGALVLAAAASWALWPRPAVQREALQRGREGPEDGVVQLHSQRALRHPQVSTSQLQGVGDPVEPLQGLATSAWDPATSTAEGPRSSAEGPTATSTEDPAAISTEGPATSTEELAASTTEDLAATTEGLATSSEDAEVEAALRSRSTAPPSSAGAAAGARAGSAGPILPPRGFQCGPGRRGLAGIQMLHVLEDTWKLDRADKSAREHGFPSTGARASGLGSSARTNPMLSSMPWTADGLSTQGGTLSATWAPRSHTSRSGRV